MFYIITIGIFIILILAFFNYSPREPIAIIIIIYAFICFIALYTWTCKQPFNSQPINSLVFLGDNEVIVRYNSESSGKKGTIVSNEAKFVNNKDQIVVIEESYKIDMILFSFFSYHLSIKEEK